MVWNMSDLHFSICFSLTFLSSCSAFIYLLHRLLTRFCFFCSVFLLIPKSFYVKTTVRGRLDHRGADYKLET